MEREKRFLENVERGGVPRIREKYASLIVEGTDLTNNTPCLATEGVEEVIVQMQ